MCRCTLEYFSFLEFDLHKPAGGIDRVVSLTRGMASADVMNRVIAVLDNNAVGRQAAEQLHMSNLPETYTVFLLPAVDFACAYPTIGPSGLLVEDVNGRACSIEFMFGEQVMRDAFDGDLPLVRWGNHIPGVNEYQGVVERKKAIQQSIRSALNVPSVDDLPDETTRAAVRSFVLSFLHAAQFPTNQNQSTADVANAAIEQLVMRSRRQPRTAPRLQQAVRQPPATVPGRCGPAPPSGAGHGERDPGVSPRTARPLV